MIVVTKDTSSDAGTGEQWKVVAPTAGPAQQFKMAALLWTLGSIKYTKVTEEKPKDLKKYGLDAAARWVSVTGFDGKEISRLTIGKDVPGAAGQKYMLDSRGEVVEADATRLADLPNTVHDVLDLPRQLGDAGVFDAGPSGVLRPVNIQTRADLEGELKARGFRREGKGLESPHGTLGVTDALLARVGPSELLEAMILRREKLPPGPDSMHELDDTVRVIEALRAVIDLAL